MILDIYRYLRLTSSLRSSSSFATLAVLLSSLSIVAYAPLSNRNQLILACVPLPASVTLFSFPSVAAPQTFLPILGRAHVSSAFRPESSVLPRALTAFHALAAEGVRALLKFRLAWLC